MISTYTYINIYIFRFYNYPILYIIINRLILENIPFFSFSPQNSYNYFIFKHSQDSATGKLCLNFYREPANLILSLTLLWLAGIVGKCADSTVCWLMLCRSALNQGRTICAACMLLCAVFSFAVLPGVLIQMGELTVWIMFSIVSVRMYRLSPLVPLDSCLTAAACLSSVR